MRGKNIGEGKGGSGKEREVKEVGEVSDRGEDGLGKGSRIALSLLLSLLLLTTFLVSIVRFETAAESEAAEWEGGVGEEEENVEVRGGAAAIAGYTVAGCSMGTGTRFATLRVFV